MHQSTQSIGQSAARRVLIIDIINNLYHHAKYIAVKVPNNYNIEKINKNFWNWKIYSIKCNNKNIYNLVIFYK